MAQQSQTYTVPLIRENASAAEVALILALAHHAPLMDAGTLNRQPPVEDVLTTARKYRRFLADLTPD